MDPILQSAATLYREVRNRGLDLRTDRGRDRALLAELARSLGCPDLKLQSYLDSHPEITAEVFLQKFLRLAEPFAKMFEEIWQYLAERAAPGASETIAVRFGLDPASSTSVDLEAFRRYVETTRLAIAHVRIQTWPPEALSELFQLRKIFCVDENDPIIARRLAERGNAYYRPGETYSLGELPSGAHPLVARVHGLFQQIVDDYAQSCLPDTSRSLPELERENQRDEQVDELRHFAFLLTDLIPGWKMIFAGADRITATNARAGEAFFARQIEPRLGSATARRTVPLLEALDVLDLPFWKDRWHTYEIWASIVTLRALAEYNPQLRIVEGRVALDGFSTAIVADLVGADQCPGCVAVQALTSHAGRDIKPDLRVCITETVKAENTALIVEFKQREGMTRAHVEEVTEKYRAGAPNAGGVILLNYDQPQITAVLPPGCVLLQGFEPRAVALITEFERHVVGMLELAGFHRPRGRRVLLLDVSGSMGDSYTSARAQAALRSLLGARTLKIYRFNDGLVRGGDLKEPDESSLRGHGGTQLKLALDQLSELVGVIDRLLLVSDGGHDNPSQPNFVSEMRECQPDAIGNYSRWLLGS
ncbi:MAG: hypothetical protein QOI07_1272 [Verrucomicrobiota bacterium]|jgi:hypothetical protein